jgi:hypothetical protein
MTNDRTDQGMSVSERVGTRCRPQPEQLQRSIDSGAARTRALKERIEQMEWER